VVDFAVLSFREQVKVMSNCGILIGKMADKIRYCLIFDSLKVCMGLDLLIYFTCQEVVNADLIFSNDVNRRRSDRDYATKGFKPSIYDSLATFWISLPKNIDILRRRKRVSITC